MSKLIIDVSQLFYWHGKLTGIPRVMNEYSQRFARQNKANYDCVFVTWNKKHKAFYSVDIGEVAKRHSTDIGKTSKQAEAIISRREGIIHKVKHAERNSIIARRSLSIARRSLHIYRNLATAKRGQLKKIMPDRGDIIFVPWGEWSDNGLILALKSFKDHGVGLVQFAHDMIPITAPQYSGHSTKSLKKYATAIYPLCDAIIANSVFTRQDIINWLQLQKLTIPPINVVRLGDDFAFSKPVRPTNKKFDGADLKQGQYLLCVGTIEARKNHALLYYVYKLALERNIKLPKLVIVGRLGWQAENTYELITKDPLVNKQMIVLSNISDSELSWLYENCMFSIYPSFYEGWGLPIAESIAHGKTCLSSNTSSMPEIAGDLINYFSPLSSDECLSAIEKLLEPNELAKAEAKLAQYKPTTWDESFEAVKAIIERVYERTH